MKNKHNKNEKLITPHNEDQIPNSAIEAADKKEFPGYPHYPPSEDIFNTDEEVDLNTEDLSKVKTTLLPPGQRNEKDFLEDMTGEDLDVPGSEADEAENNAGSEDEENNYYSLGGEHHNDLDENEGA